MVDFSRELMAEKWEGKSFWGIDKWLNEFFCSLFNVQGWSSHVTALQNVFLPICHAVGTT